MFLQLHKFKSLGRQPDRIQHMKITDPTAVKLLRRIYLGANENAHVYPFSPWGIS